ncbi:MAG: hypothetical protein HS115_11985 [Spirochaetales bacterium]|nr:hypothetical protein [Spirochaetales bacterium]
MGFLAGGALLTIAGLVLLFNDVVSKRAIKQDFVALQVRTIALNAPSVPERFSFDPADRAVQNKCIVLNKALDLRRCNYPELKATFTIFPNICSVNEGCYEYYSDFLQRSGSPSGPDPVSLDSAELQISLFRKFLSVPEAELHFVHDDKERKLLYVLAQDRKKDVYLSLTGDFGIVKFVDPFASVEEASRFASALLISKNTGQVK